MPNKDGSVHPEPATFSLISAPTPGSSENLEIAAKMTQYYPLQWLMQKARKGETVFLAPEARGTLLQHILQSPSDPLLLIGGGVGITPILSIVKYLKSIPIGLPQPSRIDIVHQVNHASEFLERLVLTEFVKQQADRATLSCLLSSGHGNMAQDLLHRGPTAVGSILDAGRLESLNLTHKHTVIISGPLGFVEATAKLIPQRTRVPATRVHFDLPAERKPLIIKH